MTNRPNLLLLQTDPHRRDVLEIIPPEVKTPHLDARASRVVHFDHELVETRRSLLERIQGVRSPLVSAPYNQPHP